MDTSFVADRITEMRIARDVSEYQMSLELGKSKSYIQGITSKKCLPSVKQLFEICDYLGISVSEFFDEQNHDSPLLSESITLLRQLKEQDLQIVFHLIQRLAELNPE